MTDWRVSALAHARLAAFARLIDQARATIVRAAGRGRVVVSTSWGKDSIVVSDLARSVGVQDLLHLASAYELDTAPIAAWWAERMIVHTLPPTRDLQATMAWLHEVGLGYEREGAKRRVTHRAKSDRAGAWCHEHGFQVQVLGLRADERGGRAWRLARSGTLYQRGDGLWMCAPLARWRVRDVWAYIAQYDLPYPALYDKETHGYTRETLRNTGWLTTIDADRGRLAWLRWHYPEQWRLLATEFPRAAAET